MNNIEPVYKVKNVSYQELHNKYDFRRFGENIVHRFVVYKYQGKPLIMGEFIYDEEENVIHINSYDYATGVFYPYNKCEFGKSKVIENINANMQKEIEKYKKDGLII